MLDFIKSVFESATLFDLFSLNLVAVFVILSRHTHRPKYQCPKCRAINNRGYLDKILCRGYGCFFHDTPDKFIEIKFD